MKKPDSEELKEERLQKNIPYKSIKLYTFKIEENMFKESNKILDDYANLQPMDLT